MTTRTGNRLGGRYLLTELIALGGMGEVWRGIDEVLGRPVAVKVLRSDLGGGSALAARFRSEARTAAMLSHPGIAAMYDFREDSGLSYLVMELVPGEPLSAIVQRDGALGTRRTLDVVAQSARGLHAAHLRGVVHRDVKPANIMVTPEGRVKVTDFGIARPSDHEPLTATGQVMGTAHYLAPEVARGGTATPLSDVYALGVVAYECLAGWRPFDGANQVAVATAHLREHAPPLPVTVPEPVRELVARAMEKHPALRPTSALEFAEALEALNPDHDEPDHDEPDFGTTAGAPAVATGDPEQAAPTGPGVPPGRRSSPRTAELPVDELPVDELPEDVISAAIASANAQVTTQAGARTTPAGPTAAGMAGTRASRRQNRRPGGLTRPYSRLGRTPLVALLGLVALVAVGSLLAGRGGAEGGAPTPSSGDGLQGAQALPSSPTLSVTPSATATTSPSSVASARPGEPPPSAATTTSRQPATSSSGLVTVRAGDYVGRPWRQARADLAAQGLDVRVARTRTDADRGTVVAVRPTGQLRSGTTVTLVVSSG